MAAKIHDNVSSQWVINRLIFLASLFAPLAVLANGPVPGINTTSPYLIYYGNWDNTKVAYARNNFRLVIVHPSSNITAANVASIQRGPDNLAGTSDDVLVLAYISIGEDDRPGAPFVGDHLGPRIDPRTSDSVALSSITNAVGLPSPGGTNYASYYLDTKASANGLPDTNPTFGGYYVNAGDPAWWIVLKTMTKLSDGRSGLDELLTTTNGIAYNCNGVFLDTLDTAAPNSFGGTTYEWTAPGMQALVQRISTNYPGKILLGNRGLFFYNPNLKTYAYNLRPYLNMVMFESYYTDSSNNGLPTASFADNKYDYAPKLNAEAGRPDGFTVIALGYDSSPPQTASVIAQDYMESMGIQGWPLYRTDPTLAGTFQTNASLWVGTNADVLPPVWDSTAAAGATAPAPRVGVQKVVAGNGTATVSWDLARDQTGRVSYNIYYSIGGSVNFATATKLPHVAPQIPANYNYPTGTGPGIYSYIYTVTNLQNGMTYSFAVRAEDNGSPAHEDTNTVSITAVAGTNSLSIFKPITIDGAFADWTNIPWAYQGAVDGNPVNFLQVQFANDTNNLYGHVKLSSANNALFTQFYTHLFVDTDVSSQTGYPVMGALFGSEMMIESGFGYDQRNGSFNAGSISSLGWAIAPSINASEFEFKLSLSARYPDNSKVFGANSLRLLLQDNRGPETAVETGIPYLLSPPQLGLMFITQSNQLIKINWTGPGLLQSTPSLATSGWTNVTNATSPYSFQTVSNQQFFRLAQ